MRDTLASIPDSVLAHYRDLAGQPVTVQSGGLINRTYRVDGRKGPVIVQRLHPVFGGSVNEDIDAVTAHIESKGLTTPRPVRTDAGRLWVDDGVGIWRALTFVEGQAFDRIASPEMAREAGKLVATFHLAVADLDYEYRHVRTGVHDARRHFDVLRGALVEHPGHRLFDDVSRLSDRIWQIAEGLPDLSSLPKRHAHGDLKISNLLFRDGIGHCLVDLDTLGRIIWPFEMGDALRSWTNPAGEDQALSAVNVDTFVAALSGYGDIAAGGELVSVEEMEALVSGLATICVILSARFLADALHERYFGFDAQRFPARGEHNLLRGQGQLSLFESVERHRAELELAVRRAFRRA
ncbi:MAG: phosphotransferase [Polyangiaceae bacterium]|nr:phosphotransferase [Polyangiaceae bacterium]